MNQIKHSKNISLNATPTLHHSILWTALMTPLLDGVEIAPTRLKKIAISPSDVANSILLLACNVWQHTRLEYLQPLLAGNSHGLLQHQKNLLAKLFQVARATSIKKGIPPKIMILMRC
ncbi:hypothetical protein [Colwellia sp. MB02u-14]|uniref:hypothetical protein n=1 Tax=Colwellia sp. MB02u-14 TaxID=2759815 RepID=UPI0015F3AC1C|nr:hypothetical protein [Colwellia sp. MB02u-14]MBA6304796.1 hypothetical protein [Colwellia sp. MB02u-14]